MSDFFSFGLLVFIIFLAYWIFGGVFFAVVGLLRLVKMRKVRFSCFFTLASFICAVGAAVTGATWMGFFTGDCFVEDRGTLSRGFFEELSCGWTGLLFGFLAWAAVLLILGFVIMRLSRSRDRSWLTQVAEQLELRHEEEDDRYGHTPGTDLRT